MADKKSKKQKDGANVGGEGFLSYSGKATVSLMHGKKTYRKFTTHNAGCMPLFKFIGRCLVTDYDMRLAPYGIRLFHCPLNSMDDEASIFGSASLKEKTTTLVPKSSVTLTVNDRDKSVTANITFVIPFTAIAVDEEGSNIIAMYNLEDVANQGSPSAFLRLASKEDGSWVQDDEKTIVGDGKTNVKIVWNMTINNLSASN